MMYKSEEEFLAAYNPDEFDRMSLTTDILMLNKVHRLPASIIENLVKSI